MTAFNLQNFEHHAYGRRYEPAARELLTLLASLDTHFGHFGPEFQAKPTGTVLNGVELDAHLLARIAAATMCLFSDPQFRLNPSGVAQLLNWHRWLSTLFSASPLRNADAVLRAMNVRGPDDGDQIELGVDDLNKFCLLFSGDSLLPVNLDALWEFDPNLTAGLCLTLLAPRFSGSPAAHQKREIILPWLAQRLASIGSLDQLPTGILHDAYMHCSYADRADKHDIKRGINALIRRKLGEWGLLELPLPAPTEPDEKPVLLVVLEWFNQNHSIYRTHSRTLEAARSRFRLVGIGIPGVDAPGRAVFDTFLELPQAAMVEQLRFIAAAAQRERAQLLYMPSVGMFPYTLFLSNMRIAPVQAYALGHPGTTHSPEMDYVVVEEDYVGDPACFSEQLLLLPSDGMPYRPSAMLRDLALQTEIREKPQIVEIAIAATTMKLNPRFLSTLARIANQAGRELRFHFLVGQAIGLVHEQVVRVVRQFLGDSAVVHQHQPYESYMKIIAGCDLFLNPFPFGNTNGIVDTIRAGLVGVCKTGREVHEHIDEGLFTRLGMPGWMVAHDEDAYVDAALRLIRDDAERCELRRQYSGPDKVQTLFQGRPDILGEKFEQLVQARQQSAAARAQAVPA